MVMSVANNSAVRDVPNSLILSNERVRLGIDLPELSLSRGDVGVVRSAWLFPQRAYEVEFRLPAGGAAPRLLLLHEQILAPDDVPA
jgi:hypothetical protein